MSWMQKLYDTYEKAKYIADLSQDEQPVPPCHTTQQAHVEIILNASGEFLSASMLQKETTLVPATEPSAGRTSGGEPHPLCDKIQYVAGDYEEYGGTRESYFNDFKSSGCLKKGYLSLLSQWCEFDHNDKLNAILTYVKKKQVISDLAKEKILSLDSTNHLLTLRWDAGNNLMNQDVDKSSLPPVFKLIPKKKEKDHTSIQDQGVLFVRWRVEVPGVMESAVWKDQQLVDSWIAFYSSLQDKKGLCYVSGTEASIAVNHPAKIRNAADMAKLISSNDLSGYTYRGRFLNADEACCVSYDVTQKAHAALRWLIQRQGFHNDDQVVVAWEVSGNNTPVIMNNTIEAFGTPESYDDDLEADDFVGDLGQEYAQRLNKKIAGYTVKLQERGDIVVMALDSSTPGRMSVTFYRELLGSEFLKRIEKWHLSYAWFQNYSKDMKFIGAPSPKEIAVAAFGRRIDSNLSKTTVSRILPCIADGIPIPHDLVLSTVRRAANRIALDPWEWEKTLGIACGLYRGANNERGYKMALENDRNTRDYLYGRLLAVAERIEQIALAVAGEERDTNAARLMQRFSERPFSTWRQIEQSLVPYKTRLQSRRPGFLAKMKNLLDEIHAKFADDDYLKDTPLSGEFLLGYHCQRREFNIKNKDEENIMKEEENNVSC